MKILITDEQMRLEEVPDYATGLNLLCSAIAQLATSLVEQVPEEHVEEVTDEIFDMTNQAFANVLDFIAPNGYEAYPDYTATALRYVEDIYLKHEFDSIPDEDKEERKQRLEQFLAEKRKALYKEVEDESQSDCVCGS